jgi:hypothetical protein
MEENKFDLKKLKEDYKRIQEKYNLPSFESLNEDFAIEKIAEIETDFLVREVTKAMAEKFSNYMHFVEMILNPVNSPLFVFSIIKTLGENEMKKFNEIYKELAKIEVRLIELDVDFSEERESIFIKETYEIWKKMKKSFIEIIEKIKSNWDNKHEENTKAYFG